MAKRRKNRRRVPPPPTLCPLACVSCGDDPSEIDARGDTFVIRDNRRAHKRDGVPHVVGHWCLRCLRLPPDNRPEGWLERAQAFDDLATTRGQELEEWAAKHPEAWKQLRDETDKQLDEAARAGMLFGRDKMPTRWIMDGDA